MLYSVTVAGCFLYIFGSHCCVFPNSSLIFFFFGELVRVENFSYFPDPVESIFLYLMLLNVVMTRQLISFFLSLVSFFLWCNIDMRYFGGG